MTIYTNFNNSKFYLNLLKYQLLHILIFATNINFIKRLSCDKSHDMGKNLRDMNININFNFYF